MLLTDDDFSQMEQRYRARFINSLSGYKSANLIGSVSAQGIHNLCIVSSIVHLGADPALLGVIFRPHTVTRDTIENIQQTGFFSVNHVNPQILEAAHQTSARYEADVSEFDAVGLTPFNSEHHVAPYVKESAINIGVALREQHTITLNNTVMVIGEIIEVILPQQSLRDDGSVAINTLETIAVAGLDDYHLGQPVKRLSYAKVGQKPSVID